MFKTKYPRLDGLGVLVYGGTMDYVKWDDLRKVLKKKKLSKKFSELFGVQTCMAMGPYAHDVESVLERIHSGKLTGTQLLID